MLDILSDPIIVSTVFLLSFQVNIVLGQIGKLSSNIPAEFGSSALAAWLFLFC